MLVTFKCLIFPVVFALTSYHLIWVCAHVSAHTKTLKLRKQFGNTDSLLYCKSKGAVTASLVLISYCR